MRSWTRWTCAKWPKYHFTTKQTKEISWVCSEAANGDVLKKKCSVKFRKFHREALVFELLFNNVAGSQASNFIKNRLQYWNFPVKIAKFLEIPILKNICEKLPLFVSRQNTITSSSNEFGQTSTECKLMIFLNVTILFNQMQSYHLHKRLKIILQYFN